MTLLLIVKIGIAAGGGPSTPRIMSKSGKTNGSRALGPLGVGSGIANRHGGSTAPVASIVLASKQFSCWDGEAVRLASTGPLGLAGPLRAAYSALFGLVPDPTGGATDDLNVPLTPEQGADPLPCQGLIVDDQDSRLAARAGQRGVAPASSQVAGRRDHDRPLYGAALHRVAGERVGVLDVLIHIGCG